MTREVTRSPNGCPDHKLNPFELYPQIIHKIYTVNPQSYEQRKIGGLERCGRDIPRDLLFCLQLFGYYRCNDFLQNFQERTFFEQSMI